MMYELASGGAGSGWAVKGEEDRMSTSKLVRAPDFSSVTELPQQDATRIQVSMLRTRKAGQQNTLREKMCWRWRAARAWG